MVVQDTRNAKRSGLRLFINFEEQAKTISVVYHSNMRTVVFWKFRKTSRVYQSYRPWHVGRETSATPRSRGRIIFPSIIVFCTMADTSSGVTRPYQTLDPFGMWIWCMTLRPPRIATLCGNTHNDVSSEFVPANMRVFKKKHSLERWEAFEAFEDV